MLLWLGKRGLTSYGYETTLTGVARRSHMGAGTMQLREGGKICYHI